MNNPWRWQVCRHPASEQSLELFPLGKSDAFGNPIDLRRENSWVQHLGDINSIEMVELQVVNNIAPFVLCNEFLVNMECSQFEHRFIINVTAVEGQFDRTKSTRHPHTNMAKAALNMLTRTSAEDCEQRGIHMVAVDPGWMSHEGPHVDESMQRLMQTPLEARDSAARIYDPILPGIAGEPRSGVLFKDFREVPW
jgi:NAD(P)-dependent dehydrogenase (short-subunit alcohol dehydrogenase family)